MLQKLKTNNFFAIKKKEVELHPHITTLVGKSACGKSSLIRSLRWLVLNRPAGDRFIHWGKKEASVELSVDNNEILRKKGKSENLYSLDGTEFRSFKNNVPEEITSLLSLTELNFQRQHELHFWFCLTAGEVAKQLNQIVNLEIIDLASSRIASKLRETKATLSVVENRIDDLRQQKRSLRWVKDANIELKTIEKLNSRIEILNARQCDIDSALEDIEITRKKIKSSEKISKAGTKLLGVAERLVKAQKSKDDLDYTITTIQELQEVLSEKIPDTSVVDKLSAEYTSQHKKRYELDVLIRRIEEWEEITCQRKNEKEVAQKELKKAMKGNCPICQRPIK